MVTFGGRTPVHLDSPGGLTGAFGSSAARKSAAISHLGLRWDAAGGTWSGNRNNFYAMWTTARALRLNSVSLLVDKNGTTFDWETGEDQANIGVLPPNNDVHEGYFPWLLRKQASNGSWAATVNTGNWKTSLNTAWGILILQPTVFGPPNDPPVALCQNIEVFADTNCQGTGSVNNGSYDPEDGNVHGVDGVTITQAPGGPYGIGVTQVTLTIEDSNGETDT